MWAHPPNINFQFEWFYFDMHSEDGYDVVLIAHTRPFMSLFEVAIFDCFVYKNERLLKHRYQTIANHQLGYDPYTGSLSFDEQNTIVLNDENIKVQFNDASLRVALQLKISQSTPELPLLELLPYTTGDAHFYWRVFAPLAEAGVQIKYDDVEINCSGYGYHDYNAGTFRLNNTLKYWRWDKIYDSNHIHILGEIEDRQGNKKQVYVSSDGFEHRVEKDCTIDFSTEYLEIKNPSLKYQFQQFRQLDEVDFYMHPYSNRNLKTGKIKEVLSAISRDRFLLNGINRRLANTVYRRYKSNGRDAREKRLNGFHEMIEFES